MGGATDGSGVPEGDADSPHACDWDHSVQFYDSDDFLCDSVADFVSDGLLAGDPLVIVSTPEHRDRLIRRLSDGGIDWDEGRRSSRLVWRDARDLLRRIMVDGSPDADRFGRHVGSLIHTSSTGSANVRVRAYGEIVDLLWQAGDTDAALRVEDLWNDLGRVHSFSLLCAYSMGNMYRESVQGPYRQVCDRHRDVLPHQNGEPDFGGTATT